MTDPLDGFDLENPELPKAIKKHAMASGGYPYEDKLNSEIYEAQMLALQKQLVLLQAHLAKSGERIMIRVGTTTGAYVNGTLSISCTDCAGVPNGPSRFDACDGHVLSGPAVRRLPPARR